MTVIKSSILLLVLAISVIAAQECTISLLQDQRSTWTSDTGTYSLYDVHIQNTGSAAVAHVTLNVVDELESSWEIDSLGESKYALPDWRDQTGGIPAGGYHQFGYVIKSDTAADIQVVGCEDVPVAEPTTAPTDAPAEQPTDAATEAPAEQPTDAATEAPAEQPTDAATDAPVPATDAPTDAATDAPTDAPAPATDAPTDAATDAPTDAPAPATDAPTDAATDAPTDAPVPATDAPTSAPSAAPTDAPSAAPTDEPTQRPSRRPSEAPSAAPTARATSAPTIKAATSAPTTASKATNSPTTPSSGGSTNGKACAAGKWWKPAPLTTWQWQITGTVDTSLDVQMYDVDLFSLKTDVLTKLRGAGRVVICYFSTQYEDWRPDAAQFTSAVIGNALDDWDGENFVDIRSSVIREIMKGRLDLAVSKGCDGVEPDNVDGYSANTGFPLKAADQLEYNKFLAEEAHKRGLSIGLKNDLSQAKALEPFFDWALNEQCYQYNECEDLNPFIAAGKAVFNTEYSGSASKICPYMNGLKFSALLKDLSLGAKINAQCCTYLPNGCNPSAYTCVSSSSSLVAGDGSVEAPVIAQQQISDVSSAVSVFFSATLLLATVLCGLLMA